MLVATLAGRLGIEALAGRLVRLRRDRPGPGERWARGDGVVVRDGAPRGSVDDREVCAWSDQPASCPRSRCRCPRPAVLRSSTTPGSLSAVTSCRRVMGSRRLGCPGRGRASIARPRSPAKVFTPVRGRLAADLHATALAVGRQPAAGRGRAPCQALARDASLRTAPPTTGAPAAMRAAYPVPERIGGQRHTLNELPVPPQLTVADLPDEFVEVKTRRPLWAAGLATGAAAWVWVEREIHDCTGLRHAEEAPGRVPPIPSRPRSKRRRLGKGPRIGRCLRSRGRSSAHCP
jgi:hypothetical protein